MRFLHTSDWHLGMLLRGGASYGEDQRHFIKEICRIAVTEKVDGILLAGDVFDKGIASQEALQIYDETMTYICDELRIPVFVVAGNHDGAERISQCNKLLKNSGLFIAGALEKNVSKFSIGNVDIYLLPWISTDKVKSIFPDKADEVDSMEGAYRVVLDKYRECFVEGHKNILVAHAYTVNAETSVSDRAAEVGHATMIGTSVFDGFDYVALGHIHGPQSITDTIRYSGSPMAYSFGKEEKQTKSVTIIDTDTMSLDIVEIPQLHKRTTLTGTYKELMQADVAEEVRTGYVRLEVTDSYVGIDGIAAFREIYANLIEISGKDFEREDARVTMTMEELEKVSVDPKSVFERYCKDILNDYPNSRLIELFNRAVTDYEKEVTEE